MSQDETTENALRARNSELEAEVKRLEHDYEVLRQMGAQADERRDRLTQACYVLRDRLADLDPRAWSPDERDALDVLAQAAKEGSRG